MPKKKTTTKKKSAKSEEKAEKKPAKKSAKNDLAIQPEINIGLVGHVDHGKTTLVKALSGKWTDTHSEELKRGITIRLGYADADFYKCDKCDKYTNKPKCDGCKGTAEHLRKISIVDAPGHESLMATMLSGASIIDGALLLVSANEVCPQAQTQEHLQALEIIGVENLIIIQNKVDLVDEEGAQKNYEQIKEFVKGTSYEDAPIIPISAQYNVNIDVLIEAIETYIKTPERDLTKDPQMFVARSFDINKPGSNPKEMIGGILGGSLKQGQINIDDELEILPGYSVEERNQKVWKPLTTKVTGLMTGGKKVDTIHPGGSIAVLTLLDPSVVKSDQLAGAVVGHKGKMPPIWEKLKLELNLLKRMVGSDDDLVIDPIKMSEMFMLNVNSAATVGVVTSMGKGKVSMNLRRPVCAEKGSRVTISRRVGQRWRLIGYGIIE